MLERLAVELFEQGADAVVGLGQGEEAVVAQARQYPALDDLHADLRLGFVFGFVGACRQDGHLIMGGQLLIAGVEFGVITAGAADATFEVIRDHHLRHSAEVLEGTLMATQPVAKPLGPGRLGKGIVGGAKDGHEDLGLTDLAGLRIDDGQRGATVIDKALLARLVTLAHGALLLFLPAPVKRAVLGVAVAAVGVLRGVLLPQELLGYALALELLMDLGPVG